MKRIYVKPRQHTVSIAPYSLMDMSLSKNDETEKKKGGIEALAKEHEWSSGSSLWDEDEEE